jgi:hypothetical protein
MKRFNENKNEIYVTIFFIQYSFTIFNNNINIEFVSQFLLEQKGSGNIIIKELEDSKIITSTKHYFYIYNN